MFVFIIGNPIGDGRVFSLYLCGEHNTIRNDMIRLKNGTGKASQVGYLAKVDDKRDGYFDIAGVGDEPIGVITEAVAPNQPCKLVSNGETLVYLHKKVYVSKGVRQQQQGDGAIKGTCMPSLSPPGSGVIGTALSTGRGLVRVALNLSGAINLSYGSMYNYDTSTTVTVAASETWYQIPSGYLVGFVNNTVFQNSREIRVIDAGVYAVVWSISFTMSGGATQEVEGTIMVNAVADTSATAHRYIGTRTDTGNIGANGIVSLNAGDVVSMAVNNESDTNNVVVEHSSMTITRIG